MEEPTEYLISERNRYNYFISKRDNVTMGIYKLYIKRLDDIITVREKIKKLIDTDMLRKVY